MEIESNEIGKVILPGIHNACMHVLFHYHLFYRIQKLFYITFMMYTMYMGLLYSYNDQG